MAAWWEDQREAVGDMTNEVEEFRDAGDCVVVFVRMHVFPRATDASFELSIAHVCTVRDAKLVRLPGLPQPRRSPRSRGAARVGRVNT